MKLYLEERKDGKLNLHESKFHICLKTGIEPEKEEVEKTINYFIGKYDGLNGLEEKITEIDEKSYNLVSKREKNRLEEYVKKEDLPYENLIDNLINSN